MRRPTGRTAAAGRDGIHYVNEDLFEDPAINALEPEILLFEPQENGKAKLVGIEYMKRSADQTPPIDASDRPFGARYPVRRADARARPGMGWHYDLHVWFWRDNPAGLFVPFNTAVSCD